MTRTQKLLCFAVWTGFPLTLALFVWIGLSRNTLPATDQMLPLHMILFCIGLASTALSVFMSSKMYSSSEFYRNNAFIAIFIRKRHRQTGDANFTIYFQLFTIALAFAETGSLSGLIGLFLAGNRFFFFIMIGVSLIGWLMAFPKIAKLERIFTEI